MSRNQRRSEPRHTNQDTAYEPGIADETYNPLNEQSMFGTLGVISEWPK